MADPLITLTTDFGSGSAYVAAMKGVILSRCPTARLVDISHDVPAQCLRSAAVLLADTVAWFPPHSIHVVVVDPGVGTDRAILLVEWVGHMLLVPDNGCWTEACQPNGPSAVRKLASRFFSRNVAPTFHGRDVFAPAAAELANGAPAHQLGDPVGHWVELKLPKPRESPGRIEGQVLSIDRFGNLITNIACPTSDLATVLVGGAPIDRRVMTYGEARPGELVALHSSTGRVEVALVHGSAAARLGIGIGAPVTVTLVSARQGGTTG